MHALAYRTFSSAGEGGARGDAAGGDRAPRSGEAGNNKHIIIQ